LLWRLALFTLPLFIVLGIPVTLIVLSGEATPYESIIRRQTESRRMVLYGPAETAAEGAFKLQATIRRRPKYLVMGSSRAMAFRSRFFRDSRSFYNSGGAVSGYRHFRLFLQQIPAGQQPRIVILCLEQRYFNASSGQFMLHDYDTWLHKQLNPSQVVVQGMRDMYRSVVIAHKYSIAQFLPAHHLAETRNRIGLRAIANGDGYRNDGSYCYGQFMQQPRSRNYYDYQFRDTLGRIERGDKGFQYGDDISGEALAEVRALLRYCRTHDIHVVAYIPPFAPKVLTTMQASGNYGYLEKLYPLLNPLFQENDLTLFDFTDMRTFGSSDREAIDGWHGGEKAYLRLFLVMARNDPVLAREVDIAALERRLAEAPNDYDVFGEDDY